MKIVINNLPIILYGVSLFTPIFFGSLVFGFQALFIGWMGLFSSIYFALPWIANLTFLTSFYLPQHFFKLKIALCLLSIVFGFFALGIKKIPVDEGGGYDEISVGIGYIIWMTSFIISFIFYLIPSPNFKN